MLNFQKLVIDKLVSELEAAYCQSYGNRSPLIGDTVVWCGYLALENIANTDALYHDVEHTAMVTLVGQAILQGKHLLEGGVTPRDWLHVMMALLCHDIGFVRGICRRDNGRIVATGVGDQVIEMPPGSTDAALAPYHVDRGKLFIQERFSQPLFIEIDIDAVTSYIEMTRFPIPDDDFHRQTDGYAGLVRAADFIGQLGDPNYLRKLPALYYELEEVDKDAKIGYKNLEDMRQNYARFYWDVVSPYIQEALHYLRVTQEGKQWIANLHSHVFDVEHHYRGHPAR
ncbi:MAG: metal-dependent phosphohydrolase [Gammaproteobacteria bacterium]|nr:MAG: metal-dependent phosphohydrolase [Gammaproteobacteria bacterium]